MILPITIVNTGDTKGSHAKYKKLGIPTRVVIIPMHDKVAKEALKSILEQADIQLDEFLNLL
ncbi:type II toxin-antitoxin system HicA family toxin [Tindallia californiensis]|uniref:type II toxin-antitoxin system HicA family toxin n=1 Tax=Tindallia californiensis TaxID=159292 RepID=UPI00241E3C7F